MATDPRHTTAFQIERQPRDLAGTMVEAYLMPSGVANTFVFGSGNKSEATAFLKDNGSGAFVLDSDPTEEDRHIAAVNTTTIVI